MARFVIYRMKDTPRENFRWAAHTGGIASVKPKDYDSTGEVEADTAYSAWKQLAEGERPLHPGDVLECVAGAGSTPELKIFKYIGFEPAQWWAPEPKEPEQRAVAVTADAASSTGELEAH